VRGEKRDYPCAMSPLEDDDYTLFHVAPCGHQATPLRKGSALPTVERKIVSVPAATQVSISEAYSLPKPVTIASMPDGPDSHRCKHVHVSGDTCLDCGAIPTFCQKEYSKSVLSGSHSEKSISKDMEKIFISEDIKNRANSIYQSMNCGVHRSKRRLQLVFYCLYQAHREMSIVINPREVAKMVGITAGEMTRSFSMFSETQTGYRPRPLFVSPIDVLGDYCQKLELEQYQQDIVALATRVLANEPKLLEEGPYTVAAGILRYYLQINSLGVGDIREMCQLLGLSEATINQTYERVVRADNM